MRLTQGPAAVSRELTATVTAVLTAALLLAAPPAAAGPHHAHDAVRYASVKRCGDDPCGPWRLITRDGGLRVLRDARTVALTPGGRRSDALAPISVSGDGRKVAYLTKAGRPAVRDLRGDVTLLGAGELPRVADHHVELRLSGDGGRLAVEITDQRHAGTRVYDTATGARLGTLPKAAAFVGFSGDGGEVLTAVDRGAGKEDLAVHADTGERLTGGTPPAPVSETLQALAADGRTVALLSSGKPMITLYDLDTDLVVGRLPVKLPAGELHLIDWTGDRQVTIHLARYGARSTAMTVVRVDTETGEVTTRDRYALRDDTFAFAACGG
ncbi:hypothetical protein [Nonomuraea sp. SBT364]|uniref:hypothetical protein n=1 Tax=Nonomuraea sp. SBT364 TaxID=1580530 RepID=UPI00066D5BFF|nr:hypothetical protein [Nonomuraea sp. SBT364]